MPKSLRTTPDPRLKPEPFNSRKRWAMRLIFPLAAVAIVGVIRALKASAVGEANWLWWGLAIAGVVGMLVTVRLRRS